MTGDARLAPQKAMLFEADKIMSSRKVLHFVPYQLLPQTWIEVECIE